MGIISYILNTDSGHLDIPSNTTKGDLEIHKVDAVVKSLAKSLGEAKL